MTFKGGRAVEKVKQIAKYNSVGRSSGRRTEANKWQRLDLNQ